MGVEKRNAAALTCSALSGCQRGAIRFFWLVVLVFLVSPLLLLPPQAVAQDGSDKTTVLLLNSYHQGFRWTDELTTAVVQTFHEQMPQADLHIEYMDSKRQYNQGIKDDISRLLTHKYAHAQPDIIITSDDNALDLIEELHAGLFPQVPVVFCGVNDIEAARQVPRQWFTGTVESLAIHDNITLGLTLFPATREIVVLSDGTSTGVGTRQMIVDAEKDFPQVRFRYLNGESLSTEAMLAQLRLLTRDTLVLAPAWYQDKDGQSFTNTESYPLIAEASPVPVLVMSSANLGLGVLGGKVNSGAAQGGYAASQAIRILQGQATVSALPVELQGSNTYLFDSRQLSRFGIAEEQLPQGSTVLFRPFSFYATYKVLVWSVIAAFSLFGILLLVLLISMQRLRETRRHLAKSEEQQRVTLRSIGDAVIATDTLGRVTAMNPVSEALTGWTFAEAKHRHLADIMVLVDSSSKSKRATPLETVLATGSVVTLEKGTVLISKNGSEHQIADSGAPITTDQGEVIGVVLVFRDITEELAQEKGRNQSRRLEAIGQLAGGVAHDFNNMLGGIIGSAEILARQLGPEHPLQKYVHIIFKAGENAASLTRKLLAFSRKDTLVKVPMDIHESLLSAQSLLERSLNKTITLRNRFLASETTIEGDSSQIENAIINLCVNSSQAMPDGGVLTIATENVELDAAYCEASSFPLEPGLYVRIDVDDTGIGMAPEVLERIFEPFFTTKGVGKGTGLGLSAVYGTVKEHKGCITVQSEPGRGTTFSLFFPVAQRHLCILPQRDLDGEGGSGCILVVDDEQVIRATASAILEDLGYTVLLASNGREGVTQYQRHMNEIDLVILDMIMPQMSGPACFQKIRSLNPHARVLISSGYSKEGSMEKLVQEGIQGFVKKPYRRIELATAVAAALHPVLTDDGLSRGSGHPPSKNREQGN